MVCVWCVRERGGVCGVCGGVCVVRERVCVCVLWSERESESVVCVCV